MLVKKLRSFQTLPLLAVRHHETTTRTRNPIKSLILSFPAFLAFTCLFLPLPYSHSPFFLWEGLLFGLLFSSLIFLLFARQD